MKIVKSDNSSFHAKLLFNVVFKSYFKKKKNTHQLHKKHYVDVHH